MQRIAVFKRVSALPTIKQHYGLFGVIPQRNFASVQEVFPHKTDFPSRHIGPRKTDVVAMLDYIGFKVCTQKFLQNCVTIPQKEIIKKIIFSTVAG